MTLASQPAPAQLDNIKAQLDLVLIALEALANVESNGRSEAMNEGKRLVELANARLKAANCKVRLEVVGQHNNVYVRATFPSKPNSKKTKPHQNRICLSLRATDKNAVKQAENLAKKIDADLNLGLFDWCDYSAGEPQADTKKTQDWIEELTVTWWRGKDRSDSSKQNTWKKAYLGPLKLLPFDQELTTDLLVNWVIENSTPETRRRGHYCTCAKLLSKLAGLDDTIFIELGRHQSIKPVNPRDLPSDYEIALTRSQIKDEGWRYIFSLLATYGLRGHEAFFLDYNGFPIIRVRDGGGTGTKPKTGGRPVQPIYPEWADQWKLNQPVYPNIQLDTAASNDALGRKITKFFNRNIPFGAYDLRHAYSRRTLECGIPPEVAARLLGHEYKIHLQVYKAWVGEKVYLDAASKALSKEDRPKPPRLD